MDFTATKISTEDITPEQVKAMIADARQQIEREEPLKNSKISFLRTEKKVQF